MIKEKRKAGRRSVPFGDQDAELGIFAKTVAQDIASVVMTGRLLLIVGKF